MAPPTDDRELFRELLGDGRPALTLTAVALAFAGAFAVFISFRREFLPQDVAFLGMTSEQLCAIGDCRIVRFMFHDRVAFGGTLLAIAALYLWLIALPLRDGARWAWRTLQVTGSIGFASFLAYMGYGYLDRWHAAGTVALLPVFALGLARSRPPGAQRTRGWLRTPDARSVRPLGRVGRIGLLTTGAGMALAGLTILYIGVTEVFVAEDLGFMGLTRATLDAINPRLVPLIAHDRAGFGGGVMTTGILILMCAWFARPTRAFHEAMLLAGLAGFGCGIGTHYVEGYVNPLHLAPAFAGAALFIASWTCEVIGTRAAPSTGGSSA